MSCGRPRQGGHVDEIDASLWSVVSTSQRLAHSAGRSSAQQLHDIHYPNDGMKVDVTPPTMKVFLAAWVVASTGCSLYFQDRADPDVSVPDSPPPPASPPEDDRPP